MTERYFPVMQAGGGDSEPLSDRQWGELGARARYSGVDDSPGGPGLWAYRTPSGVFVRPGVALNCLTYYEVEGTDLAVTPQLVANASGFTRYDLLTLRRDLSVDPDPTMTYVVGDSSAAGPAPSFDPATVFDVPIAVATVPSGATIPTEVTDARQFLGLDVIPCRTVADIPAVRRRIGMHAYESTTDRVKVWSGRAWQTVAFDTRQPSGTSVQFGTYQGQPQRTIAGTQACPNNGNGILTCPFGETVNGVLSVLGQGADDRYDIRLTPTSSNKFAAFFAVRGASGALLTNTNDQVLVSWQAVVW